VSGQLGVNQDCITFAGDLHAPEVFRSELPLSPPWVCNLEGPVTKAQAGTSGKINLKIEEFVLEESLGSLPAAVSLANNHIMDYGEAGLKDTLGVLQKRGIQVFGLGRTGARSERPARIKCAGLDVALLGYVCRSTNPAVGAENSPSLMDDGLIEHDIQQAKLDGAARVVLCLHWGQEEVPLPTPQDRLKSIAYVRAGADLIVGHHSHCIQSWEVIDKTPVFYGLGNLVMPDRLRIPDSFDDAGHPQHWCEMRQHKWNRESLLVDWHPASREWHVRTAVFRRGLLKGHGVASKRRELRVPIGDEYARRHENSVRSSRWRAACADLLTRPRVPTRRGLIFALRTAPGRTDHQEGES